MKKQRQSHRDETTQAKLQRWIYRHRNKNLVLSTVVCIHSYSFFSGKHSLVIPDKPFLVIFGNKFLFVTGKHSLVTSGKHSLVIPGKHFLVISGNHFYNNGYLTIDLWVDILLVLTVI